MVKLGNIPCGIVPAASGQRLLSRTGLDSNKMDIPELEWRTASRVVLALQCCVSKAQHNAQIRDTAHFVDRQESRLRPDPLDDGPGFQLFTILPSRVERPPNKNLERLMPCVDRPTLSW